MSKALMSAEEICAFLDVSRATFYRWKDSDDPPPAALEGQKGRGRSARYDLEAVKEWKRRRDAEGPLRVLVNELPAIIAGAIEGAHAAAVTKQARVPWELFLEDAGPWYRPRTLKTEGVRMLAGMASSTWVRCLGAIAARAEDLGISGGYLSEDVISVPKEIQRLDELARSDKPEQEEEPAPEPRKPRKRKA